MSSSIKRRCGRAVPGPGMGCVSGHPISLSRCHPSMLFRAGVGAEKVLTVLYVPSVAHRRLEGAQPPSFSSSSTWRPRTGTVWCLSGDLSEMCLWLPGRCSAARAVCWLSWRKGQRWGPHGNPHSGFSAWDSVKGPPRHFWQVKGYHSPALKQHR